MSEVGDIRFLRLPSLTRAAMTTKNKIALAIGLVLAYLAWAVYSTPLTRGGGGGAAAATDAPPPYVPPPPPPPKKLKLTYVMNEGWLVEHDFVISNTSGEDLTDVHMTLEFIGEDASPEITRYWAEWPLGTKRTVSFPVESVSRIQRINVSGSADQGIIVANLAHERP